MQRATSIRRQDELRVLRQLLSLCNHWQTQLHAKTAAAWKDGPETGLLPSGVLQDAGRPQVPLRWVVHPDQGAVRDLADAGAWVGGEADVELDVSLPPRRRVAPAI
jgi:hypothetical protein